MAKQKRIKRNIGDIVRINLSDGLHSYGIVLPHARFAFFDYHGKEELIASIIIEKKVLFHLFVMDYAVTSGMWSVVAHVEPNEELLQSPLFFKQDAINKVKFFLYRDGKEIPATRQECEGLERLAVWDPEHVETRLLDHFCGRSNIFVESLKIKI